MSLNRRAWVQTRHRLACSTGARFEMEEALIEAYKDALDAARKASR